MKLLDTPSPTAHGTPPWRALPVLLVALLSLAGTELAGADLAANRLKSSQIAPPNSLAYGKTLTEWLTLYWRWNFTGADPAQSTVGPVQFLPLPAGEFISGSFTPTDPGLLRGSLELTLKPGTPFVLPLFAWSAERYDGYPGEPDDVPIDSAVALGSGHPTLTIDGKVVITDANKAAYFVPVTEFDPIALYPVPTDYGAVGAASFQGVGIVGTPLLPGIHVIHLHEPLILNPGDYPGLPDGIGVIFDNTWTITVK